MVFHEAHKRMIGKRILVFLAYIMFQIAVILIPMAIFVGKGGGESLQIVFLVLSPLLIAAAWIMQHALSDAGLLDD